MTDKITDSQKVEALEEKVGKLQDELHRQVLKSTALKQRIAELAAEYEEKIADYRVLITVHNEGQNG